MRLVKIGLACINVTVGATQSNTARCLKVLTEMEAAGVTVACLPEQVIGGYPAEDLVQWNGFVEAQWTALQLLTAHTAASGMVIAVGVTVAYRGHLFNCAAVLHRGRILGIVPKEKIPNYNVFYELRTFSPGTPGKLEKIEGIPFGDMIFDFDFGTLAVEICEDAWSPDGPMRRRCYSGAELVLNLSASPFRTGIAETRREMLATRSSDNQCTLVYVNLVGANDGLIFDGGGYVFSNGRPLLEMPRFQSTWKAQTVDLGRTARLRSENTTWHLDAATYRGSNTEVEHIRAEESTPSRVQLTYPVPEHHSFFLPTSSTKRNAREEFCEDLLDALSLGIGDYYEKVGAFSGFGIALSGGRDSLLTLLITHRYLLRRFANQPAQEQRTSIREHLHCFYMPSRFSGDQTRNAAARIAEELGAQFLIVPIEEAFQREEEITQTMLGSERKVTQVTRENIQARLRSLRMWNWSNSSNFLFLQSGNMSEKSMGYTTIGGDLEGALSVLANVPKTVVILLLEYLLQSKGYEGIRLCFEAPAGPELATGQRGEEELMPYRALDVCFYLYAAEKLNPPEIARVLDTMFPQDPPEVHDAWVQRFVRLFNQNIYKWVQAPLSLHVGNLDLERERALQLPVVQSAEWSRYS